MSVRNLARAGLLLAALYGLGAPFTATAAPSFYEVTVTLAGGFDISGTPLMMVQASDTASIPAFTNRFFVIADSIGSEGLATGLSAIALSKTVLLQTDIDLKPRFDLFSVATGIFLKD